MDVILNKLALLVFLLAPFFTNCNLFAQETDKEDMVFQLRVLSNLPSKNPYDSYDYVEVFIDVNGWPVVMSSYGSEDEGKHSQKLLTFAYDGKKWISSENILPGYPTWFGMVYKKQLQVCSIDIPQSGAPDSVQTISIYDFADLRLASLATKTIRMDGEQTCFKEETSISRYLQILCPLDDSPNRYFIIGEYTESKLNLWTLIGRLVSGGHGGYADRLFGAILDNNKIVSYHNIPEKAGNNEYVSSLNYLVRNNKIHVAWQKGKNYSGAPVTMQYSQFDLVTKNWSESVEFFREYKYSNNMNQLLSGPSLACDLHNIYSVWSWKVSKTSDRNTTSVGTESGIYFSIYDNDKWAKPTKIAGFGFTPKVVIDRQGTVFVFWTEPSKGLFYKFKTAEGWSDVFLAIKDKRIRAGEMGIPRLHSSPTFSIVVDKDNNFHIAYARESSESEDDFLTEEIVYLSTASNMTAKSVN